MSMIDRREFLRALSGAASVAALAMPARVSANDTINVGCIGTGGRCRGLMHVLKRIPGVRLGAVCDVWDAALDEAKAIAEPGALATKRYGDILERDDIDAVLIGSPDHWHVPMTVDACRAGKDVYVEKPLTHDLDEGARVIRAQNENQRIVQVGMQQRSMPHVVEAMEILRSGALGTVHKVHITWNRNAPAPRRWDPQIDPATVDWPAFLGSARRQPFDEYRFRNWRWFWDFGGGILTDLMVHWIDVVNWFLDLGTPQTATTIGDHFHSAGVWETPDTIQTLLRYPDRQVQVYFEGTFVNAHNAAMMEYMGTDATLYVDRGRYEVHPERGRAGEYHELVLGTGPRGADFYDQPEAELLHLVDWIECVRTRQRPCAPAEAGVQACVPAHLANRAYRESKSVRGST